MMHCRCSSAQGEICPSVTSDFAHNYTFDAEGNVTAVDGGQTAQYVYNALNQRVRTTLANGAATEYVFNAAGQRDSTWDGRLRLP